MIVYSYNNQTHEFVAAFDAPPNGNRGFFVPAFTTETAPPETGEHEAALFDPASGQWTVVPDFRATKYWDTDGKEQTIDALGETLPAGASLTPPPPPAPTAGEQLKTQIAQLESQVTARRMREAVLGDDEGWLEAIDRQIAVLREELASLT